MKWDNLIIDLTGIASDEMTTIDNTVGKNWELVVVVRLPLCRRAYFKREASEAKRETSKPLVKSSEDEIEQARRQIR